MNWTRRAVAWSVCVFALLVAGCTGLPGQDGADEAAIAEPAMVAFTSGDPACTTSFTSNISSRLRPKGGGTTVNYTRNVSLPDDTHDIASADFVRENASSYALDIHTRQIANGTGNCSTGAYVRYRATIQLPHDDQESWDLVIHHDGRQVGTLHSDEEGSGGSARAGGSAVAGSDAATDGDGTDRSSPVNVTALAYRHHVKLLEAGSFAVNHSERVLVEGEATPDGATPDGYSSPSFTRQRVNFSSERYRSTSVTVGSRRSAHYVDLNVTASRDRGCPTCGWNYSYLERDGPDSRAERIARLRSTRHAETLANLLQGATVGFSYGEPVTVEGDRVTFRRYRAEQTLDTAPPPFDAPPTGVATIDVDGDGVIRQFTLRYDGTANVTTNGSTQRVNVSHVFERSYTDVGSTEIARPGWLDDARSANPLREVRQAER